MARQPRGFEFEVTPAGDGPSREVAAERRALWRAVYVEMLASAHRCSDDLEGLRRAAEEQEVNLSEAVGYICADAAVNAVREYDAWLESEGGEG